MQKIKQKIAIISIVLLAMFSFSFMPTEQVFALTDCTGSDTQICKANNDLFGGILKEVINVMLYLAGAIAVIMIVVGGIRYITSDGDPGAATKAKSTIIYALVGLVIAVMSYSIVNFVVGRI